MPVMENDHSELQPCVRCCRALRAPQGINITGDKAIAIYVGAQTVGFRPRVMSKKQRRPFCVSCAVSIANGPPPEGEFNMLIYEMCRDIVKADKSIQDAAWEIMANPGQPLALMPGSRPDKTLDAPLVNGPLSLVS
jgi:hypothetical protein